MATEKWIAGAYGEASPFALFGAADLNGLAPGDYYVSSVTFDNSAALDEYMQAGFDFGTLTTAGSPVVGLYAFPFIPAPTPYAPVASGLASGTPSGALLCGMCGFAAGSVPVKGVFSNLVDPRGMFRLSGGAKLVFALYNGLGVTLGSGNVVNGATWNRQVA